MNRQTRLPRRGKHTNQELRELILTTAIELIRAKGLEGLSAREIAKRIDYSPGTLYNVFKDREDIILNIESRLLDQLDAHLEGVENDGCPRRHVTALANAYLAFTQENAKLWNLLFEHRLGGGNSAPDWYQKKIDGLMSKIERAIEPFLDEEKDADPKWSARVLWAGVHGIRSLSTTGKLTSITNETAMAMAENLVATYLDGLEAGPGLRSARDETGAGRRDPQR
jgi:AcrR family transcriptional regulator